MRKIVTIIGARPQFIKAATVSRAITSCNRKVIAGDGLREVILHTGQHFDDNMSQVFFDELEIPRPDHNLGIGSDTHGRQTGKMLAGIETVLSIEQPDLVLTYGDTNSTLAGALAAAKLQIPSAHVEAGLRSFNRLMPEEINRVVTDELSNLLFCPSETAVQNLLKEGIGRNGAHTPLTLDLNKQMVFQVGDVMYDSILFNKTLADEKSNILTRLNLRQKDRPSSNSQTTVGDGYCLVTLHRAENTDNVDNLRNILQALNSIASYGTKIVFPVHPRTRKCIEKDGQTHGLFLSNSNANIIQIEPVSYLDMIKLETHAQAIFTDSGGMQKEAYLLGVPCVTLREETEWVETVRERWNILTGSDSQRITAAFSIIYKWNRQGPPFDHSSKSAEPATLKDRPGVYGDGKAAERIVEIISDLL